jgi:histidinol-phosphate aminotransferase
MFVNKYVKNLKPYSLVSHKAWEIEDKEKVLKLDWNEATISPSPKVKQNIIKFLEKGNLNWYPDVNNKKLLNKLAKYNKLPVENILYFASSDSLHEYIVKAFINPEDKLIIVAPTYDNFRASAESVGANINFYFLDNDFKLNIKDFIKFLKKVNPKLVYLCNPNNPTGTMIEIEKVKHLIDNFKNTLFIIDEAYYEFVGKSCKDLVLDYNNLIITRTFSKAFALASFRIGYVISSVSNINLLLKIRNPKNITTLSQIAAISALEDIEYMKAYVNEILQAKEFFRNELLKLNLKIYGDGGNFILIKLEKEIKRKLISFLETNNIFIRDYGHVKGMENYCRITIGTKDQMKIVIEKMKEFFKNEI